VSILKCASISLSYNDNHEGNQYNDSVNSDIKNRPSAFYECKNTVKNSLIQNYSLSNHTQTPFGKSDKGLINPDTGLINSGTGSINPGTGLINPGLNMSQIGTFMLFFY
jgi:hypothetical protein